MSTLTLDGDWMHASGLGGEGREPGPRRYHALDVLRGVAILLMILDHVIGAWLGGDGFLIRATLCRAALPLFMVTSGFLLGESGVYSWVRLIKVCCAAVVAAPLYHLCGFRGADILLTFCVVMPLGGLLARFPIVCACVAVVQLSEFRLPFVGYQPGEVALLLCLGVLWERTAFRPPFGRFNGSAWLAKVGRYPLTWYLCHLAVIAMVLLIFPGLRLSHGLRLLW